MQLTETQKRLILAAGGNDADVTAAEAGEVTFDFGALTAALEPVR